MGSNKQKASINGVCFCIPVIGVFYFIAAMSESTRVLGKERTLRHPFIIYIGIITLVSILMEI